MFVRSNSGAALAEAAISIPLLVAIMLFVIEVGRFMYISNCLTQAANTAARYAAVHESYSSSDLVNYATVQGMSYTIPNPENISIDLSPDEGTQMVGDIIIIMLTYDYSPLVNPFILLPGEYSWPPPLMATAKSRAEIGT